MRDSIIFTVSIVLAGTILVAGLMWGILLFALPGDRAQIEQLRADSAHVDPAQAEDVIGQVTQWNQKIVSMQAYDDMFLIGIVIPDGWQDIEPIPVPR